PAASANECELTGYDCDAAAGPGVADGPNRSASTATSATGILTVNLLRVWRRKTSAVSPVRRSSGNAPRQGPPAPAAPLTDPARTALSDPLQQLTLQRP